jgi:hypothetical protein
MGIKNAKALIVIHLAYKNKVLYEDLQADKITTGSRDILLPPQMRCINTNFRVVISQS